MSAGDLPRPIKTLRDPDLTEVQPGLAGQAAPPASTAESTAFDGTVPPPVPADSPPFAVPGYEDWQLLGSGTFGQVWRAREAATTIPVAIKFFLRGAGEVEREVRRLAQLAHTPGIVRLAGVYPGAPVPFLVMEYADHGSLAARTARGPLPAGEALRLFREIAEALAYVHSKGILHCDLKPGNVLLDSRDHVRLADFGQAQLASDLTPSLGTFFYMAPEQAQITPQPPDTRWDVYGLGAILYQMLTGQLPRHDAELAQTLQRTASLSDRLDLYRARIATRPRPAAHRKVRGVDRDLADIVDRCLELDPARRFPDASAVLAALARREQRRKQRPMFVYGVVGPLLLMSLVLGLSWWQGGQALAESSDHLAAQRVAGNKDTARLVAHALQRNLRVRLNRVGNSANAPPLRQALAAKDREAMERFLDERLLLGPRGQPSNLFHNAWVTDTRGRVLAAKRVEFKGDAPFRTRALDIPREVHHRFEQFTWRDWFSGKGDLSEQKDRLHPMVAGLHVSDPFVTVLEGVGAVIAVSKPIRLDPDDLNSERLGLLSASVSLRALAEWLSEAAQLSDGGEILVLNHARDGKRSLILDNGQVVEPRPGETVPRAYPDLEEALTRSEQGVLLDHAAPTGGEYLAGYARTTERLGHRRAPLDWVVLVRHEKGQALNAIERLREKLWRSRLATYGLTAALMAGLWAWLFWLMRRRDSLARAW